MKQYTIFKNSILLAILAALTVSGTLATAAGSFVELKENRRKSDASNEATTSKGTPTQKATKETPVARPDQGITSPKASGSAPDSEIRADIPKVDPAADKKTTLTLFSMGFYHGFNTVNQGEEQVGPVDRMENAGLLLVGRVRHRFHPTLVANLKLVTLFESGSSRALLNEDRQPVSGVFLDNGELNWRPVHALSFSAGALNQGFLESPLFVKDSPFPALQQGIYIGPSGEMARWQLRLVAQEAIPTSRTLGAVSEKDEPFAKFYTQSAFLTTKVAHHSEMKIHATHYDWQDLSSYAATQGRLGGNSTTAAPPPATELVYGYHGYEGGGEANFRLFRTFELGGGGNYLINTSAPDGQNVGRLLFGQMKGFVNQDVEMTARGEAFINQADSSPAAYNAGQVPLDYGHNNREGSVGMLRARFVRYDFAIRAMYIDSRVIDENPFQQNDKTLFVSLEALYDIL